MIRANMASTQRIPSLIASKTPAQGSTATNITENVNAGTYLIDSAIYGTTSFTSIVATLDGVAVSPSALLTPATGNTVGKWVLNIESAGLLSITINVSGGFSALNLTAV